jgi:hypothetical protein
MLRKVVTKLVIDSMFGNITLCGCGFHQPLVPFDSAIPLFFRD